MAIIADDPAPVADMAVDEFLGTSPGPSWRRWLKWLAIAAAAILLTILIGRFVSGGLATEYASEPVVRSDIRLGLFGTGRLQPVGARAVGAAQEGTVQEILVQENQPVSEGEVLARLDPAPFREARDRARELLDTRQAAVEKAHAAKADIDRRLALYQRVRRRSGGDVPSNREMAAARDAARRAADALDAAQVELAAARTDLAEREAQLASADIRSPIDGVVIRRAASVGQVVGNAPGQALFTVAEPYAHLRLEIVTDRAQAARLLAARPPRAFVSPSSGKALAVPVARVAEVAAPPRPERGPASAAPVGIALEIGNPGLALRVGTNVSVQIPLGLHRDVLVVPDAALRFAHASDAAQGQQGDAVYVTGSDGKLHRVPVARGGGDGRNSEVASDGLKPGMRVVTGLR